MQRYVSSYFWCGDMKGGPMMNYSYASLPTMTRFKGGLVCEAEEQEAVAVDQLSGDLATMCPDGVPPKDWEIAFSCNGVAYAVRGFVDEGDSVGLNMANGMWVHLRFARFDVRWVDPETKELVQTVGYGASEFGYRIEGVEPQRPTTALLAPVLQGKTG